MSLTYVVPPKPAKPFAKGDAVRIMDRTGNEIGQTVVVSAWHHRVTTRDGRDWTTDGWWLDDGHAYPFPTIQHVNN